ncbi:HAD family hydrolase [Arthrobacter sp. AET 35A]|uniref:HAD family hydrolase n=1 Tax=Arthrobacter sp. AET 35A TaxID=2292643 RepID=UPI00177DBD1D|nr:HAD family phosphatase [Arthrobacter sp. AET 35A]MBE0011731.1 HAD family phosphatase [Arthrobacter sp. AET 35A]
MATSDPSTAAPISGQATRENAGELHDGALPEGLLQAVLWDMDGTIVDTEPYWIQAEKDLVAAHGGTWSTTQAEALVGQALSFSAGALQEAGVALSIRDIIDHLIAEVEARVAESAPWRPGARELLAELVAQGIPCAMVTMSERPLADEVVRQLPPGTFDFLVTGDMVQRGKPDPEPYQLAFDALGGADGALMKHRVVAIEDSLPGATSAEAAGLVALAVPHMGPLPTDRGWYEWPTLANRTVADLTRLVHGHRGAPVEQAAL